MVHGLTKLLTLVMTAKRDLKRVYYTQRSKEAKLDSKELVAAIIGVQRLLEELIELNRKRRAAKKVLEDRKVELVLRKWSTGLPQRVKGFIEKSKKLELEVIEMLTMKLTMLSLMEHIPDDSFELIPIK